MFKWRVEWMESERGWGRRYFHTDYDSEQKALDDIRRVEGEYPTTYVPDFYIQSTGKPEKVWVDSPADENYVPRHRKED